jgi:hypothetical protein
VAGATSPAAAAFADQRQHGSALRLQIARAALHRPFEILKPILETLRGETLPAPIRQHRLLEPLIWLRRLGVRLATGKAP